VFYIPTNQDDGGPMNLKKLEKKLLHDCGKAIHDFTMIEDGDRIMACISGGKDSLVMLELLEKLRRRAPVQFDIIAVNLDQKQPGFPSHILPAYFDEKGYNFRIIEEDTYSIVTEKIPEGKTTCSLCSRLRRGILYNTARKLGCNKLALGHHRDDLLETFFLNMFFNGAMKSMPPKLLNDTGDLILIRPLAYAKEATIAAYAEARDLPIIPCNLCGSQDGLKRQEVKAMIHEWDKSSPGRSDIMFAALQNVTASHLADPVLFDFKALSPKETDHVPSPDSLESPLKV